MRNSCLTKRFGHSTLLRMPVEAFYFEFLFFYVPCFYAPAHVRVLYLKNLSGPHPENFKGSGISSRLEEH